MAEARDPRDVAREYLRTHNVDRLFQELGSALVFTRPSDVDAFLLAKLKDIQAKKSSREQSSIFDEQDLQTLFRMFDKDKQGRVSKADCLAALKVLGVEHDCEDAVASDSLAQEEFVQVCNACLAEARDRALPPEAAQGPEAPTSSATSTTTTT